MEISRDYKLRLEVDKAIKEEDIMSFREQLNEMSGEYRIKNGSKNN